MSTSSAPTAARYAIFSVWATLAVVGVFVVSIYDAAVASVFLTLYLTWSPWHYTGQNYGLSVMFLRRAGVALEPPLKRWLHASFLLSYALVFLSFHKEAGPGVPQFNAALGGGTAIAFWPIGIPERIADALFAVAVGGLRRDARRLRRLAAAPGARASAAPGGADRADSGALVLDPDRPPPRASRRPASRAPISTAAACSTGSRSATPRNTSG